MRLGGYGGPVAALVALSVLVPGCFNEGGSARHTILGFSATYTEPGGYEYSLVLDGPVLTDDEYGVERLAYRLTRASLSDSADRDVAFLNGKLELVKLERACLVFENGSCRDRVHIHWDINGNLVPWGFNLGDQEEGPIRYLRAAGGKVIVDVDFAKEGSTRSALVHQRPEPLPYSSSFEGYYEYADSMVVPSMFSYLDQDGLTRKGTFERTAFQLTGSLRPADAWADMPSEDPRSVGDVLFHGDGNDFLQLGRTPNQMVEGAIAASQALADSLEGGCLYGFEAVVPKKNMGPNPQALVSGESYVFMLYTSQDGVSKSWFAQMEGPDILGAWYFRVGEPEPASWSFRCDDLDVPTVDVAELWREGTSAITQGVEPVRFRIMAVPDELTFEGEESGLLRLRIQWTPPEFANQPVWMGEYIEIMFNPHTGARVNAVVTNSDTGHL